MLAHGDAVIPGRAASVLVLVSRRSDIAEKCPRGVRYKHERGGSHPSGRRLDPRSANPRAKRGVGFPCSVLGRVVVRAACDRAGLPRVGAHSLRHAAATEMLRAEASLPEIGQVLRHRTQPLQPEPARTVPPRQEQPCRRHIHIEHRVLTQRTLDLQIAAAILQQLLEWSLSDHHQTRQIPSIRRAPRFPRSPLIMLNSHNLRTR